ncbi:hypothetical protein SAMN05421734_102370 [Pelagirhabdus alkalitolerans]|uniref:Uncharacterized protein n=1 Tax=Pelagirhabdus alkalitolerans TaxID=1612202 RepID=A0A1G6H8Q9_9BACI|nr:hypothetical protein [Pelagirhabdus alkalitolerans]SDB90642.1 hypothetical protein SAMN05421734_102370 [Pelagirhabdus alkalitolerans]
MTSCISRTNQLIHASIGLALTIISLVLFRGTTSIVSFILIPVILAYFSQNKLMKRILMTAFLIVVLLVAQTQLIFAVTYILLTNLYKPLFSRKITKTHFALTIVSVMFSLIVSLMLTEWLFQVPIHSMMLELSNHIISIYVAIIFLESIFIVGCQLTIIYQLKKRLAHQRLF